MVKFTVERTGFGHTRRIVRDGEIVGLASQTSSGKWMACDANDHRLCAVMFPGPTQVKNWFRDFHFREAKAD